MISLKRIVCWFNDHDWRNDNSYPVHGYKDLPYEDSYCDRCGITGKEYLK
jgi:hypothetical protein